MRAAVAVAVALAARVAHAGPCTGEAELTPGNAEKLPVRPRIAYFIEGHGTFPKLTATIDDKPVKLKTRDIRSGSGRMRFYEVQSDLEGWLELTNTQGITERQYQIVKDWTPPTPTATVKRATTRQHDPKERVYESVVIHVPGPVIAFEVRWRANARAKWASFTMPAEPTTKRDMELFLGSLACGQNIPMKQLDQGIELEVKAMLPNGKLLPVEGLPSPFKSPS